jgi:uncharacterized protein (DUF1015 family)
MPLIKPFAGLRPASGLAQAVAAPPYDVLTTEEARQRAADKPWSFLHISKPEIDLPIGTNPYAPEVYVKAVENLRCMLKEKILVRDSAPCYYVYRIVLDGHSQTGLVVAASVAEYDRNRIRRHEFTRPDKEDDRVCQIDALNAQTGPVLLAYPHQVEVDRILADASTGIPDAEITASNGARHSVWLLREAAAMARLTALFDAIPTLYIADGHHRSAAASRVAAARHAANPLHTGNESYNYFLAVIFPHHQMRILSYNRVVDHLRGMSAEEFLAQVAKRFDVQASITPVTPQRPGEFGLYLGGAWHRLTLQNKFIPADDPVGRLDASLLTEHLLRPILGIEDLRRDKHIDFVGGNRGEKELQRRVDSGEMAAAFALYPTRMEDLMAVADAGEVMPPKSTWFEPKLADGLVSHMLD